MHESEGTVMRLTEQNKLLKEEVRRLERNQAREQHMANMEYLKNIVFKVNLKCISSRNKSSETSSPIRGKIYLLSTRIFME